MVSAELSGTHTADSFKNVWNRLRFVYKEHREASILLCGQISWVLKQEKDSGEGCFIWSGQITATVMEASQEDLGGKQPRPEKTRQAFMPSDDSGLALPLETLASHDF